MVTAAIVLRLVAVIAAIIGIVNITGIPDNSDLVFGIVFLFGGIVGWFTASRMVKESSYTTRVLHDSGGELSRDKTELLLPSSVQYTETDVEDGSSAVHHDSSPTTKPSSELLQAIELIGQLKNRSSGIDNISALFTDIDPESAAIRGCFNVLGLYIQLQVVPPSMSGVSSQNRWTLQAGTQLESYLDAWKTEDELEWNVENFQPGEWEKTVFLALQLAEFLPEHFQKQNSLKAKVNEIQAAGEHFMKTGELVLPG